MQIRDRPFLILGNRLLAEEVADFASEIDGFRLAGFVENMNRRRCHELISGLPVHWVDALGSFAASHQAVVALTTTRRDRFVDQAVHHGIPFGSVIHPSAQVSRTSSIGEGSIVSPGVVIASHSRIGRHTLLNRGALIGHHTELGDYVSVNPGANIAGACSVGAQVYVGMGAVVLDKLTIGEGAVIGAGAVVTKNVPARALVVGVPASLAKSDVGPK